MTKPNKEAAVDYTPSFVFTESDVMSCVSTSMLFPRRSWISYERQDSKHRPMDWAEEKVLVFGGSGFLGANIVHFLVTEKGVHQENIRTLSNRATHALDDLPEVEQTEGNILDPAAVARACEGRTIVLDATERLATPRA